MYVFFREGGWVMYPVLAIGLLLVIAAIQFAIDRQPARRPFITTLLLTELVISAHGTISGFGVVMWALTDEKRVPDNQVMRILFQGMKEITRPTLMGLAFMAIALLAVSIGVYRTSQRELQALRG